MGYLKSFRYLGYLGPIDVLSILEQIVPFQDSRPTVGPKFSTQGQKGRKFEEKIDETICHVQTKYLLFF